MTNESPTENGFDSSRTASADYPPDWTPAGPSDDGPTVKTYQAVDGVVLREPGNRATTIQAAFEDVLNLGDMR